MTGGTRGIGAAVAEPLASEGAQAAAVYTGNHEVARSLRDRLVDAGEPAELAHAVRLLLEEAAGYVTGSVVTVDGGLVMGA